MRSYWKGDGGQMGEFAQRFTGSADLYEASGRKPHASITLSPPMTVSRCRTWWPTTRSITRATVRTTAMAPTTTGRGNWGVEGPTYDPQIRELRERQKRSLIATLLLSQGVAHGAGRG